MHCFLINVLYILSRQLSSMTETKWKTKGEGGIHAADQLLNDDCVKAFSIGLVLSCLSHLYHGTAVLKLQVYNFQAIHMGAVCYTDTT